MINKSVSTKLYEAIKASNKPRPMEVWHASSIAQCPRALYLKRHGVHSDPNQINPPTGAKILRWATGHHYEQEIRQYLDDVYGEVQSNNRLTSKKLQLTGEYDNLVGDRLIEIKTVHDYAFKEDKDGNVGLKEQIGTHPNGNKKWAVKTTPYLVHELQNHAYVMLLAEDGVEVKHIDYIYISLSGRIVVYSTEVQPKLIENVEKRLEALNKAWESQEPPVCICREDHPLWDSVYQWCDFRTEQGCCNINLLKEDK